MIISAKELMVIRNALHLFYTKDIMNRLTDAEMDKVEDAQVVILSKLKGASDKNKRAELLMNSATKKYGGNNGKNK